MSRLYINAQGRRGVATRCADYNAVAQISYNFDGGNSAVGSMVLRCDVDKTTKAIRYVLSYLKDDSFEYQIKGIWHVFPDKPTIVVPETNNLFGSYS